MLYSYTRLLTSGFEEISLEISPFYELHQDALVMQARANYPALEFRLGEIENIPAADCSFDVVISNCVINLSSDKARVLKEAYRVLRKGGRLAVADVVQTAELPEHLRTSQALSC